MSSCLRFVDRNAKQVFGSEQFKKLDISVVNMIVSRDTLRVKSEIDIVNALLGWAKVNGASSLNGAQYLVRFLTLSADEFENCVVGKGLLPSSEEESILTTLQGQGKLPDHLTQLRYYEILIVFFLTAF